MSKELRKQSKKNLGKLVDGDGGKWVYLPKVGSDPAVLFMSLASGKIDKTILAGREVQAKGEYALHKGSFYLHVKTGKIDLAAVKAGVDPGFQWEIGRPPEEEGSVQESSGAKTKKEKKPSDKEPGGEEEAESDDINLSEDPKLKSTEQTGDDDQETPEEGSEKEGDGREEEPDGLDDLLDDPDGLQELLREQRQGKERPGSGKKPPPKKEEVFKSTTEKARARARFLARQEGEVGDLEALLVQAAKDGDLDAMDYFRALGFSDEDLRDPDFPGDDLLDLDEDSEDPGDDGLEVEELPEDGDPALPKKLAKKLKKRSDQQKALVQECAEAARLYQDALRIGASDTEASAPTRRAKVRLVEARAAALAWLEASAKEIAKNRAKKSENADLQRALDELQKLVTHLTNVHAEGAPDQLGPAEEAMSEEELEELRPRIPWVLSGDPVLLTCQEKVDARQAGFVDTLAELQGGLEVLEGELKDRIFRGLSPSDEMKERFKEGKETLERMVKEREALIAALPATRQALVALDPAEVTEEEKEEVGKVISAIEADLLALAPELAAVEKVGKRVRKLAEAKAGDIADSFVDPAHGKAWKQAAKVAMEQEELFRKGRKTASEAVSYGHEIKKLRAAGKNADSKLQKLKALEVESAQRQKAIFAFAKEAAVATASLEKILPDAADADREELSAALDSLAAAQKLQPTIIAQLAAVRSLYQQLSGTGSPGDREPGRPFGLFRSSEVLAAFLKRLHELAEEAEGKGEDVDALEAAATGSPELETLYERVRTWVEARELVPKKLAMALRNLDRADAALGELGRTRDPEDADLKRWQDEAETVRTRVEEAQPTISEPLEKAAELLEQRRIDLGTLPDVVNVPTLAEFGIELQNYPAFEQETEALMPTLPTYHGNGRFRMDGAPIDRREVRAMLVPLRPPAKQRLDRVRNLISRLKYDLKTLNKSRDRLPPGRDLIEVEKGRRQIFLLRESLDTLKSCLKRFIHNGEKLYDKAN